jgi:hypothetical protein
MQRSHSKPKKNRRHFFYWNDVCQFPRPERIWSRRGHIGWCLCRLVHIKLLYTSKSNECRSGRLCLIKIKSVHETIGTSSAIRRKCDCSRETMGDVASLTPQTLACTVLNVQTLKVKKSIITNYISRIYVKPCLLKVSTETRHKRQHVFEVIFFIRLYFHIYIFFLEGDTFWYLARSHSIAIKVFAVYFLVCTAFGF